MKKWQAGKEEMQCSRKCSAVGNAGDQEFLYGIAKFLQGLRKFRNGNENFAILAKFRYGQIFAIIAKMTVHREIQIFTMPTIFAMIEKFRYHSEISLYSESYCA